MAAGSTAEPSTLPAGIGVWVARPRCACAWAPIWAMYPSGRAWLARPQDELLDALHLVKNLCALGCGLTCGAVPLLGISALVT
jgi:hypothetical protein